MATAQEWWEGARPRTLPAAISPVLVGTGAAAALGAASIPRALLAAVVALALQVGVNYANDYSDGIRGTDKRRVGPMRLVGSGAAPPEVVKRAAFACFGVAAVAGLALVALSGAWWLLAVGAACIVAAWYYTGGSRPYGYAGLGEVFVFLFFGLVAVLGTTFTQAGEVSVAAIAGAVGVGALSCALLVANNLRDIPTDSKTGKTTLAVILGDHRSRMLYVGLTGLAGMVIGLCAVGNPWAFLAVLSLPLAIPPVRTILDGADGRDLIPVLGATGRLILAYSALLGLGLAL